MPQIEVLFDVPTWVASGLSSRSLKLFGGVVRDNTGKIVYMLKDGAQRLAKSKNPTILIGAVVLVAVAGIGYYAYQRFSRKALPQELGERVESGIHMYLTEAAEQKFSLEQIRALSQEIEKFVATCEENDVDISMVFLTGDIAQRLADFYLALVDFNHQVATKHNLEYQKPGNIANSPNELLSGIRSQLDFQSQALAEINAF